MFFCEKLSKPCRYDRTFQLVSQQSLASIIDKNSNILTKRPPVATTVPSGANTVIEHWYTLKSTIQARVIPLPSWGSVPLVTTGSLWSLQWASQPSTLQKRHINSLFMIIFWDYGKKGLIFDKIYPFDCIIYLSGAICWIRQAD